MPATWVSPPLRKTLVIGIADMIASNDSTAELLTYSLGSCLGVTAYDPATRIGGLLHVMLPDSSIDTAKAISSPFMFVDTGLERLWRAMGNLGADSRRVVMKVAGGAQLFGAQGIFNIGERNIESLRRLVTQNGYRIQAQDVGGVTSRTIRLDLATGRVSVKSPGVDAYFL